MKTLLTILYLWAAVANGQTTYPVVAKPDTALINRLNTVVAGKVANDSLLATKADTAIVMRRDTIQARLNRRMDTTRFFALIAAYPTTAQVAASYASKSRAYADSITLSNFTGSKLDTGVAKNLYAAKAGAITAADTVYPHNQVVANTAAIAANGSAIAGKFNTPTGNTGQYINGTGSLTTFPTLGTAAAQNSTAFATAAQGTLAGTALQGTGTSLQYIAGNGTFITFPTIPTNNNQLTNGAGYITTVPAQSFTSLTGKPTTISGYGITDAYPLSTNPAGYLTSVPAQSFASLTSKPTTLSGYGITDAYSSSNPSGYITGSALSPYLTTATAATTYQPLLGYTPYNSTNPSGYVTASTAPVTSVNTRTGAITITSTDVTTGLGFTPADASSSSATLYKQNNYNIVVNTTTETSAIGTGKGSGSLTLPANFWTVGKKITVPLKGTYQTPMLPGMVTVKVKLGSVTVASVTIAASILAAMSVTNALYGEATITCYSTGTSGTVVCNGYVTFQTGIAATVVVPFSTASTNSSAIATATINTTVSGLFDVTETWSTASTTQGTTITEVVMVAN